MALKAKEVEIIPTRDVFVGDVKAPVTLTEYGDYESEACAKANEVVDRLLKAYDGKMRFNFRHFPLTKIHQHAMKAAEASLGAAQEGKFWEMHNTLFAHRRRLGAIRAGERERDLEAKIAGVSWKPDYAFGRAFWDARDQVSTAARQAKLDAYVADPDDGASPIAIVNGLARLQRGELLSQASTTRFLQIMAGADTGPMRLKAGIGPGWSIAHKTGTSNTDSTHLTAATNDAGILTLSNGAHVYVTVFLTNSHAAEATREHAIALIGRLAAGTYSTIP